MRVLNILLGGGVGGIENLCKDIGRKAKFQNAFFFIISGGLIYEEMKKEGLTVHSFEKCLTKKISFKQIIALKEYAKNYDVIVVHHNSLITHLYYVILKLVLPTKKYVFVAHSCFDEKDYFNQKLWVKRFLRKLFLKRALCISDKVIFVSKAGKRSYLQRFLIPEQKMCVIYNGIDINLLKKETKSNEIFKKRDSYRITYIGRLVEIKGVHLLIDAVLQLINEGYNVYLDIIGEGNYRNLLEQKVKDNNLEKYITFQGVQRNISIFLNNSDIFVYPSICEEVFGISIVEAMSYEIPCVANRVGGIPEVIIEQYNGAISENKTGHSIAQAIKKLINLYETDSIGIMKQNCRKTALKFDINITVKNLNECYEELLKKDLGGVLANEV